MSARKRRQAMKRIRPKTWTLSGWRKPAGSAWQLFSRTVSSRLPPREVQIRLIDGDMIGDMPYLTTKEQA